MSTLTGPPRYVPTLTEVVHPAPAPEPVSASTPVIGPAVAALDARELLVQRILQRLDPVLEQRLQQAVEQLVLEHTRSLMLRLREEIERVLRESVVDAFEREIDASLTRP